MELTMTIKRKLLTLGLLALVCIFVFASSVRQAQAANRGAWAVGVVYNTGDTVTYVYNGTNYTYTCIQGHTSVAGWDPPYVPALWTQGSASTSATAVPTAVRTNTPVQSANRYTSW